MPASGRGCLDYHWVVGRDWEPGEGNPLGTSTNPSIGRHGDEDTLRDVGAGIRRSHPAGVVPVAVPRALILECRAMVAGRAGFHVESRGAFVAGTATGGPVRSDREPREPAMRRPRGASLRGGCSWS